MKQLVPAILAAILTASCRPEASPPITAPDVPLLSVTPGDTWVYQVHLKIPEGVTSVMAAAVDTKFERTRTYLGKISAAAGLPETDCFEVTVPGFPTEREFVEILDDRILLRGSLILRPETTQPLWLESPVAFVIAGMQPGDVIPSFKTPDDGLIRRTEVLAREDITVPAGTFHCIRLLTTGIDGNLALRRNVWFAPGHGIIREEKTRQRGDQLIFRETQELVAPHKE